MLRLRSSAFRPAAFVRFAPLALLAPLAFAATIAPAACSSSAAVNGTSPHDGGTTSEAGPVGDAGGTGPVARFVLGDGTTAPNFLDVPFPSDAYLANGSVLATIPGLDGTIPSDTSFINYGLSKLNGFSRIALAIFAVDNPGADAGIYPVASAKIDPTTLPVAETDCAKNTSSVFLLDLAAGATTPILPCRAAFHDDQPRTQTTNPVIAVGPPRGYLLEEGHPYAVVLTSRVKDTSGRAVGPSADFAAVAGGVAKGTLGTTYATAVTAANAVLKSALATDGATIVSIAPFTTMKKSSELFAMRAALESAPAPTLAWDADTMKPMAAAKFAAVASSAGDGGAGDAGAADGGAGTLPAGFTASLDAWLGVVTAPPLPDGTDDPDTDLPVSAHNKIAALGTAVFNATSYLQVKPTGYGDPDHGTFQYDDAGAPVPQTTPVKIWISFSIPTAPMPAAGYPVVIVQHGLDGSREFMLALANTFNAQGWAVAAIDSVTFGARAPEPSNTTDTANDFAGPGSTYTGPDGFADTENGSTDFFGNLSSILAIRDQLREGGFDTAQVVKLLRSSPDLSPLATGSGTPTLDPSRIAYIGDSLGAMEGTIAAAIEPRVAAWYLNVNAGSLFPELAAHSPGIGALLAEAAGFNFGITGDEFTWSHPLMQVLENIVEPGDPITYAHYLSYPQAVAGLTNPRNVVQTEAIWDEVVTDEANEAIARAAGWGLATPNVGSNADITDLTNIAGNPRATPFTMVSPDTTGAIHDTPVAGATAVLIQCGPAEHGVNLVGSQGQHNFQTPFSPPFQKLVAAVPFTEDYRGLQSVAVTFFRQAFAGTVPNVYGPDGGPNGERGFSAPVRDQLDGGY